MKTILATIVSMFLFVSFANAQAKSCADLIKSYDTGIKTTKLDAATTKKAGDLRKSAGDALAAKKEADCVKAINEASKVAGLTKPAAAAPAKKN
ncbi:MAG: hypothetical protein EBW89_03920 [Candidatus Fonsibacter ubiquis]|nr:hypothetical protein [Pseudomonadota bacterium]NCU45116.1 hypothetical protein [Candidatus Fonsibacter ubiquis]NCU62264.1 hypothetical protein [Candidatus Fonsibacter ubiquis]